MWDRSVNDAYSVFPGMRGGIVRSGWYPAGWKDDANGIYPKHWSILWMYRFQNCHVCHRAIDRKSQTANHQPTKIDVRVAKCCVGIYHFPSLQSGLPLDLGRGGTTPKNELPWWCHQLRLLSLSDGVRTLLHDMNDIKQSSHFTTCYHNISLHILWNQSFHTKSTGVIFRDVSR